ncbi:MAG: hypothetical protein V7K98_16275 [Nostoc sp.]|uniref:hypothetical protein n=1 Tax=Nostoc sp. TaxID=1180 RepID=UPI002FFB2A57
MGHGAWAEISSTQFPILLCERLRQRERSVQVPNAQCPMPNAQCPMPNAQCPMPNAH